MRVRLLGLILIILMSGAYAQPMDDIDRAFLSDQYSELMVGETTIPTFERPSAQPLTLGVAIVFASHNGSDFPLGDANQLAALLNEKGWRTLVIPLHLASVNMLQNTETPPSNEAPSPREDNRQMKADFDGMKQQIMMTVAAATQHNEGSPGFRLIIASGMHATVLLELGVQNTLPQPDSMIAIGPHWPEYEKNQQVPQYVADSVFPLLDIVNLNRDAWDAATAPERARQAKTTLKLHYRQRTLVLSPSYSGAKQGEKTPHIQLLAKEIIGWSRYLGW